MEQNIAPEHWTNIKAEIQKSFKNVEATDLENTHGNVDAIADLVCVKQGLVHEEAEERLAAIISKFRQTTIQKTPGTTGSGTIEEDSEEQAP